MQYTLYATSGVINQLGEQYYSNYNNGTMSQFSVPSSKQVLTPSTTGVTITSTAGGSLYNWTSETSGFNRNDTSYTYSITSSTTVYSTSYSTAPAQVFEDGGRLTQETTGYTALLTGQWYLDTVNSRIWVRLTGDDPPSNGHTIQASQRAMAIDIGDGNAYAGVSYITVQGIHATMSNGGYGNIGLVHAATNHVIISGVTSDYSANDGIKISSTVEGGDINITGNVSNNNLGIGVSTNQYSGASLGHEVYIQYNNVSANQADGIETYGNYAIIQYNTVHDSGTTSTDCIGIHIYSASGSDGLGQHNIIRYNTVYNQMSNGLDGSGIETDHYAANNSLYGNVIYNNQGPCIDLWDSASVLVYNNTCYGNLRNPAFPGGHGEIVLGQALGLTNNITVENNITYPTSSGAYSIYIDATTAAKTLAFVHNLWYDPSNSDWWYAGSAGSTLAAWNSQTFAGSDLYGNPLMVAPASANFLPQPTSPALAVGVFIPGVSTESPPNIGAN
jgi:parallel beta-helix repeat protein